jgi:hypothetical protein
MSQFVPKGSPSDPRIVKFAAGAGELLKTTDDCEAELGLRGRVDHKNGDGIVHDLARLLNSFYTSLPKDPRLLTTSETEALYEQSLQHWPVKAD